MPLTNARLVVEDEERFNEIVNNPERPVQFIFAGKAHPKDEPGKEFIKRITALQKDPRFANRVVFLEDYDMNVARHLVQGATPGSTTRSVRSKRPARRVKSGPERRVELLGPRRMVERSVRRKQRVRDRRGRSHINPAVANERDNESLLNVLENVIVPMFYERNEDGLRQGGSST